MADLRSNSRFKRFAERLRSKQAQMTYPKSDAAETKHHGQLLEEASWRYQPAIGADEEQRLAGSMMDAWKVYPGLSDRATVNLPLDPTGLCRPGGRV